MTKLLINYDANINETDVLNATPLHRAAAQGRNNIVERLLATPNIIVDICDSTGSTPLYVHLFFKSSYSYSYSLKKKIC